MESCGKNQRQYEVFLFKKLRGSIKNYETRGGGISILMNKRKKIVFASYFVLVFSVKEDALWTGKNFKNKETKPPFQGMESNLGKIINLNCFK